MRAEVSSWAQMCLTLPNLRMIQTITYTHLTLYILESSACGLLSLCGGCVLWLPWLCEW